jgi:hypothetical protein
LSTMVKMSKKARYNLSLFLDSSVGRAPDC